MSLKEGWRGRFYEDFEAGDVYRSPLGRTISEADNTWFTLLTMNTNQVHFNADFAARTPFGKILVNSGFTIGLVLGMSVSESSQNAIANLAMEEIQLTHPVFVGDTIYVESRVISKRQSASRPYAGIVTIQTRGLNQDGDVVLSYRRSFMVYKRAAGEDALRFPEAREDWPEA
jgi:acyl dehydratase